MDQTFGIFIKSQADLDALNLSEEHTKRLADELKKAGQAAQQSGKAQEQAAQQTTNAFQKTTSATKVLTNEKLGLQRAAGAVATSLTGLGAAGSIAPNALLAVATGARAAGVVIGVVSTVITFLIQRMNEATEKKKSLDAAMRSGDLGFFSREISEADQKLIGLTQRVDALRARVQTRTGSTFFGATGVAGAQRELAEAEAERAGLVGERQKILGEKVGAATLALQFQTQAIGANVTQQQELEHELRVIAALQGGLKDATQAAKDAFIGQSAALRDEALLERERLEHLRERIRLGNEYVLTSCNFLALKHIKSKERRYLRAKRLRKNQITVWAKTKNLRLRPNP